LQTVEQQGYIQLNSTAIKIPFNFHGSGTQTKPVYFTADANVSSLAFIPSVERQKDSPLLVWVYLSEIQCTYNPATNTFTMADSYRFLFPKNCWFLRVYSVAVPVNQLSIVPLYVLS
jgi:hypothetical protein